MSHIAHHRVTVGVTDTALLEPNQRRVGLILSAPPSGAYEISFTDVAVLGSGIRIPAGTLGRELWAATSGTTVKGPVRGIAEGAAVTVGITEILGP